MASTPETITPNQLKQARSTLWHQDGDALRTLEDTRQWLETAGLVPYYPHAQFAAPQPSFAEAVLGRPQTGWIPKAAGSSESDESYAVAVEDEEPADEVADPDEDFDEDEDFDGDEADDEETTGGDEEDGDIDEPEASDDEVMLSDDDEIAEDEGDEIAEIDRIDAGGDPVPNDLREGTTSSEGAEEETAAPAPVNGFNEEEKETVRHALARLVADGAAVPLNLLGSSNGEPDFVCSAQAFSFVYTLRGDKGWKQEPSQTGSMRVSPLAAKVYALLKEKGAMAPHELTADLGQGIVDSAVLRALSELWAIQRVVPLPDADGGPARWELMTGRFIRHIKAGANAGQPTALSALLSLYLSQAVAATSDEMEIYLSPLAARSRVREVVGGLAASRQLDSVVMEGKTLHFMPGALEALPADRTPAAGVAAVPRSRYEDDDRRAAIEERAKRFGGERGEERRSSFPVRRPAGARGEGTGRPGSPRPGGSAGGRREGGFAPRREGGFAPRREGGFAPPRRTGFSGGEREGAGAGGGRSDRERRPFTRRDDSGSDRPRNEFARPWEQESGERKPFAPRGERPFTPRNDGERRPFTPREGGDRRPFAPRGDRPFTPRGDGERRPFTPREGSERRPFAPRGDRPFTPRADGERRPFTPREGGERKPFAPRDGGERRPFAPRGDRPFTPRGDGERRPFTPREGGERRPFAPRGDRPFTPRGDGERRPFTPREGGERKPFVPRGDRPFAPRGDGERRPFTPREGGERKPFAPRGDRPFTPRGDGERRPFTPREGGDRRPFAPRGDRPFTPRGDGERRPFTPREGGSRGGFGGARPNRDRFSGEPGEGRPSFQSGAKSAGPGGAKFGGAGAGRDRKGAGGFNKPGFSPARRGPGSGPGRGGAPKRRPE